MVMEIIVSVILLIVGIAILIIIHICVVGRAFRGHPINSSNPVRAEIVPGLSPEDIKALPSLDYRVNEESGPGQDGGLVECAVCLEGYKSGEKCRVLPKCNHIFHCECIDSWLLKNGACPVCRATAKTTPFGQGCSGFSGEEEAGVELV
ncbi:hypothetical protein CASFOL_013269 [Castilleja foliolosa]|uniref:RING-type domain-containing protein n=1 Tax=Castilleja foliolosa TaxID=1961234 RepID=A0ABD3DN43_9LAMI